MPTTIPNDYFITLPEYSKKLIFERDLKLYRKGRKTIYFFKKSSGKKFITDCFCRKYGIVL